MTPYTPHATPPQPEPVGDVFMPSVTIDGRPWTLADQARVCAIQLREGGYHGDADMLAQLVAQLRP